MNILFKMLLEVDFVDKRDCVSEATYGGGGLLVEARGDEEYGVFEVDDIVMDRYIGGGV